MFVCGSPNKPLEVYTIDFGTDNYSQVKTKEETIKSSFKYFQYYSIVKQTSGDSSYYDEDFLLYVLVKTAQGGKNGISLCKKSNLEEIYFYEVKDDFNGELISDGTSFYLGWTKTTTNTLPTATHILYFDFLSFSGIEGCEENFYPEKGFFSKKCKKCSTEKYTEKIGTDGEVACVEGSECKMGISLKSPKQCHSSSTCTDPQCEKCENFKNVCMKCIGDPGIPGEKCVKKCATHESYSSETQNCFDCLEKNKCVECQDLTQKCGKCKLGYELKGSETKICTKICPGNNIFFKKINVQNHQCVNCLDEYHCEQCSYDKFECSKCLTGYHSSSPELTGILCEKKCNAPNQFYEDNVCKDCSVNDCVECLYPSGECKTCKDNYFPDSPNSKRCVLCPVSGCKTCSSLDTCKVCNDGFKVIQNKNCGVNCSENHLSAQRGTEICIDCKKKGCSKCDDFTQICHSCVHQYQKVDTDDKTICVDKCPEAWSSWSQKEGGKCIDCREKNCEKCDELTQICTECKKGYEKDENDLTKCILICSAEDHISDKGNGICVDCLVKNNCVNCDDKTEKCQKCKEGFEVGSYETNCISKCQVYEKWDSSEGKCVERCPGDSNSWNEIEGKCIDCLEKYECTHCSEIHQHCSTCLKPEKVSIQEKCVLRCKEPYSSWNVEKKKCINCLGEYRCSECDQLTQKCSKCEKNNQKPEGKFCVERCPDIQEIWNESENTCVQRCPETDKIWDGSNCVQRCQENDKIWDGSNCVQRCPETDKIWDSKSQTCVQACQKPEEAWDLKTNSCVERCAGASNSWNIELSNCINCLEKNNCSDCEELTQVCNTCKEDFRPDPRDKSTKNCIQECKENESFDENLKGCFDCLKENNCSECEDFTKKCKKCKEGFILDQNDDKKCVKIKKEKLIEEVKLTREIYLESRQKIILDFNKEIQPQEKIEFNNSLRLIPEQEKSQEKHGILIKILNLDKKTYTSKFKIEKIELDPDNKKRLELVLEIEEIIERGDIEVHRIYPNTITTSEKIYFKPETEETLITKFGSREIQGISPEAKKRLEMTGKTARTSTNVMLGMAFFFMLPVYFIMLKLLQHVDYTLFINIILPKNVQIFLNFFKRNFFGFLPNIFEKYALDLKGDYQCQTEDKFAENELECLIFENTGSQILEFICLGIFKLILFLILKNKFSKKSKKTNRVKPKIEIKKTQEEVKESNYLYKMYKFLNFEFLINTAQGTLLDFFISAVVNITNCGKGGNTYVGFNLFFSIILLVGFLILIILIFYNSQKIRKAKGDKIGKTHVGSKLKSWTFLENELKQEENKKISLHFFSILFLRDFLIAIFVSVFMKTPKIQISSILATQIFFVIFFLSTLPYEQKSLNWITGITELFYTLVLISFAILIFFDFSSETKYTKIGWVLLISYFLLISSGAIFLIKETLTSLFKSIIFVLKFFKCIKEKKSNSNNLRNKIRELNINGVNENQRQRVKFLDRREEINESREVLLWKDTKKLRKKYEMENKSKEEYIKEFQEFKEKFDEKIEKQIDEGLERKKKEERKESRLKKDDNEEIKEREVNIVVDDKKKRKGGRERGRMNRVFNFLPGKFNYF